MELAFSGRHYPIIDPCVNLPGNLAAAPFQVRKDCARGIYSEENELPRSKLLGIRTNRESLAQLSPPHVSSGGPVLTSPGFPLKACGNDGLRNGNKFYAASCGELDPVEIKGKEIGREIYGIGDDAVGERNLFFSLAFT